MVIPSGRGLGWARCRRHRPRRGGSPHRRGGPDLSAADQWGYSIATDVLGAVIERGAAEPLPEAVRRFVTSPLSMADAGFVAEDSQRLAVPYADAKPEPARMTDLQTLRFKTAGLVRYAPARAIDHTSFPSGGAGMIGSAADFACFLEALRTGGAPILAPATAQSMTLDQIGDLPVTNLPGWGFGYGAIVLRDQTMANSPQAPGTWALTSAYDHSYFVDPRNGLTVVAFTNTAL